MPRSLANAARLFDPTKGDFAAYADRKQLVPSQFAFSALQLNECERIVGGWSQELGGASPAPSSSSTSPVP